MNKDVDVGINALKNTTQMVVDNGFLAVAGGVVILIVIIFLVIVIAMFRSMMKRADDSQKDNKEFMNTMIDSFKENMRQDREDRIKIFENILKQINITNEKLEIFMEGMNCSFQGVYAIIGETYDKINEQKELTNQELLQQSIVLIETYIHIIKDIMLIKVEKNSLKDQVINNIGNDTECKGGEIYDTITRNINEAKSKIKLLNNSDKSFKSELFISLDKMIDSYNLQICELFKIENDKYNRNELNTKIRLVFSRFITSIKSLKEENLHN